LPFNALSAVQGVAERARRRILHDRHADLALKFWASPPFQELVSHLDHAFGEDLCFADVRFGEFCDLRSLLV
jgi:hypothetical protein